MDGCLSTTSTTTSTSTLALKQSVDSHTLRQGWIKKKRSGEQTHTVLDNAVGMDRWMDGVDVCSDGWMDGYVDGSIDKWIDR